jgi:hypothetical protein
MQYLKSSFTVGGQNSDAFREGYDRIFGKRSEETPEAPPAPRLDVPRQRADCGHSADEVTSYRDSQGQLVVSCRVCEAIGRK